MPLFAPVSVLSGNILSGATLNAQPAAGEEWAITCVEPQSIFQICLTDGTLDAIFRSGVALFSGKPLRLLVTNSIYLKIKNGASGSRVYYGGMVTRVAGSPAGIGDAKLGIASVLSGASINVQPPAGEGWVLHDLGADNTLGNAGVPKVGVAMYDGTNSMTIPISMDMPTNDSSTSVTHFLLNRAVASNSVYFRLSNGHGSTHVMGYVAQRIY